MIKLLHRLTLIAAFLLFWITFTLLEVYYYDNNFFVLNYPHSSQSIKQEPAGQLLEHKKITGEIKAENEYLGIIEIKINPPKKVRFHEESELVFRLKEKGTKEWTFTNSYKSGIFYDTKTFPFGFPPIKDSKDKIYQFELKSLDGTKDNAITIDTKNEYPIRSKYQIPKELILKNWEEIYKFAQNKTKSILSNIDLIKASFVFHFPLVYYLVWLIIFYWNKKKKNSLNNKIIKRKKYIPIFGLIIFIFLNIFFVPIVFSLNYIVITIILIMVIVVNKLKSLTTFLLSSIFLGITISCIIIKNPETAAKSAQWLYIFVTVYIVQRIKETTVK